MIPDCLEGGCARDRYGGRRLEREVRRLRSQLLDCGGRELRERAVADPVDGVAEVERADVRTYRLDTTRDVPTPHTDLRIRQTARRTERKRHPGHVMPIPGEEACGLNAQQHLTAADRRGVDVLKMQDASPAVFVLDDRPHRDSLRTASRELGEALTDRLPRRRRLSLHHARTSIVWILSVRSGSGTPPRSRYR